MIEKKTVEAGMRRRIGQSDDVRREVGKINNVATNWVGTCRKCGKMRQGTIVDILKPCGCDDGR